MSPNEKYRLGVCCYIYHIHLLCGSSVELDVEGNGAGVHAGRDLQGLDVGGRHRLQPHCLPEIHGVLQEKERKKQREKERKIPFFEG